MRVALLVFALMLTLEAQDRRPRGRMPGGGGMKSPGSATGGLKSFKGNELPDFKASEADDWLYIKGPLSLQELKGLVILVEISNHTCPECAKLASFLDRWHKDYSGKGLVVISIDDGTSPSIDTLKQKSDKSKYTFPIFRDKTGETVSTYEIKFGTASYLIGTEGTVIWEGLGLRGAAEIEKLVKEELKKVGAEPLEAWKKKLTEK